MPNQKVEDHENLFRAIIPQWWNKKRKKITSAAFKDSNGVSVDRDDGRDIEAIIYNYTQRKFKGESCCAIAFVNAGFCYSLPVYLKPASVYAKNKLHVTIQENEKEILISEVKIFKLKIHANNNIIFCT